MAADARVDILLALKAQLQGFDGATAALPSLSRAVERTATDIKAQTRSLGADLDAMGANLKRAFSPVNLAKGFLAGAGIGGGVALVNLAIDKWAAVWRESAEHAAELQARAEKIAEAMQATSKAAREAFIGTLDLQAQRVAREQDLAAARKRMADAEARRESATAGMALVTKLGDNPLGLSNAGVNVREFRGERFGGEAGMGGRTFYQLMQERADAAQLDWDTARAALNKARIEITRLDQEIAQRDAKSQEKSNQDAEARAKKISTAAAEAAREQESARQKIVRALEDQDRALENLAEKYRQLADPAREYALQQEEINMLLRGGKISADEAAAALAALARAAADAEEARVDAALRKFFGPLDQASAETFKQLAADARAYDRELAQLWNNVSDRAGQAFADVLLDGTNAFRSLAREIARSIIEITARLAIINPVLNAVFGGFKGFEALPTFFGKATATAAGGGSFVTRGPTNFTVGDNPGGVELVSVLPLSGVGRSSINGRSLAMAGGGTALAGALAGDTFNFAYSFTGGVTAGELARMLPQIQESSKAGVLEAMRRKRDGFR